MKIAIYLTAGIALLLVIAGVDISLLIFIAMVTAAIVYLKRYSSDRTLRHTIREIDLMTGEEFEQYAAKILRCMGYKADVTQSSGDYGADVVASRLNRGKTQRMVVQCKRYQGKVGISAVQEIVASKAHYKAEKAMVITNSYFTDAAINLAQSNKVVLWDRDTLQRNIRNLKNEE